MKRWLSLSFAKHQGWYLQRWWRIPLTPQAIVDGHIREPEQLVAALLPWSRELPRRHHIHLSFPANRTLQKKFHRPTMTLREPEQTAWLSGSMARELDMAPDALHFDYSEDTLSPAFNVTAAQSKEDFSASDAYPNPEGAGYGDYTGCQRVTANLFPSCQSISSVWYGVMTPSGYGRPVRHGDVNQRAILAVLMSLPRHCLFPRQPLRNAPLAASIL